MTALAVEGVSVSFGGVMALSEVSFAVPEGQVCGVIGPNGAGKTTLFDVVSGLRRPRSGRVLVAGADVTGDSPYGGRGRGCAVPSSARRSSAASPSPTTCCRPWSGAAAEAACSPT
ncbi:ATP-binding cassette domain-containing protein [Nonomuraea recticatena]|uniref:ATP-binding cassette domain-containing protein n=1 Tax=Nonomuraea recticatena TaxID=46178 RepID=UPI0036099B7A